MCGCVEFHHRQKGLAAKQNLKTRTSCIATHCDISRSYSGDITALIESGTNYQVKALLRKESQLRRHRMVIMIPGTELEQRPPQLAVISF